MEKNLEQLLEQYAFPNRFLVYFASQIAKKYLSVFHSPDIRVVREVEIAEKYGLGENFSPDYLRTVMDENIVTGAYSPSYYAITAALVSSSTEGYSSTSDYVCYTNNCAASATGVSKAYFVPLLIQCIRDRMSIVEQVLVLGDDIDIISKSW